MQVLSNVMLIVQILSAVVMIGLVLIQHGKGADMGASFGSGASGSLFGATGSANFLSRSTAVCATVFFVCTLALAFMSAAGRPQAVGNTVLDRPASAASVPASAPVIPGAVIPGAVIPGAASAPAAAASPAR
jgi:preprotein translocase subunit SecG